MKSELFVLSIATASPMAFHTLKSVSAQASAGVVVTSYLQGLAAAADLTELSNAHAQPVGRSLDALARLKGLSVGWDGADAPPPSKHAIENAQLVIEALEARGVSNARISADVDGGVVVTVARRIPGQYAAVACDNDGDAHLVLEVPPQLPKVIRVAIAEAAPTMIDFAQA